MSAHVVTSPLLTVSSILRLQSRNCSLRRTIQPFAQSRNCSLVRTVQPLPQSVEAEAEKGKADWPGCLLNRAGRTYVTRISESKCMPHHRLFEKMQPSTAKDIRNKPFVSRIIRDERYFTAISLEEDNNFSTAYNIYPPFPSQKGFFFCCSCEGLFCFENNEREIVLSNPTTNEFKILPKLPELPRGVSTYSMSSQIWFDHKSEDYKVMFLVMADFENEQGDCIDMGFQIDLYSLKANSWKRIPCTGFSHCTPPSACINGVYYCEAYREGESTRVILSFDLSTETISSLPLPEINKQQFVILEYNGLLSILAYSPLEIDYSFELWVMNESWARESIFHTSGVDGPLCFWKRGELLCFESFNHELLVFDRVAGKLKHINLCSTQRPIDLFPFVESAVQLKGGSDQVVESSVQLKGGSELEVEEEDQQG